MPTIPIMHKIKRQSIIELTAAHVRKGLQEARWEAGLPGVRRLAADLDVSHDSVRAALRLLESEGLLCKPPVAGRGRQLTQKSRKQAKTVVRPLRVALLPSDPLSIGSAQSQQLMLRLQTSLEHAGHEAFISTQALSQLDNNLKRLARLVRDTSADAWVVYSASQEMLAWFIEKQIPVIAIGGHTQNLPIACSRSDNTESLGATLDLLVMNQHRRIVLICPLIWRQPDLHHAAKFFLKHLAHHGLKTSDYNLPNWEETAEGTTRLFESLFKATPPTALLIFDPSVVVAALLFLSRQGLRVPEDVSLVSLTEDPVFSKLHPALTHFEWEIEPHLRRITRWVCDLARGRADNETKTIQTIFIPGGTIGPSNPRR